MTLLRNDQFKILWITQHFPPKKGGMAESAKRQVQCLRRNEIETDVVFFEEIPHARGISIISGVRDNGTDIVITHTDQPGNSAQLAWRDILKRSAQSAYTLIVGFGAGFAGYTAVTYAAWLNIPALISVRGNDFDRDWFEPRRAYFVNETLRRADSIAAVSHEKVRKIQALYPEKQVFWLPNGVDWTFEKLLTSEKSIRDALRTKLNGNGKRIIGIFGKLKYKKRVPMMLAAIRERGLLKKISLLIAGTLDIETEAILSDPSLSPLTEHIPFCERDNLPQLYAACDFIAIPSLFEGFPNVLLEAMAAGAVPIVSDAGAMPDVITHGKTGFMFNAVSQKDAGNAFCDALALSNRALSEMRQRVRTMIKQQFSLEQETKALLNAVCFTAENKRTDQTNKTSS